MIFPPGTILQRMYAKERLKNIRPGTFIEIGVGEGHLSGLLLERGWHGIGYDLNEKSLAKAAECNREAIVCNRYTLCRDDWLSIEPREKVDMVISCMVLEHLDEAGQQHYFEKCKAALKESGLAMLLVPASPTHWGIEDEIAGHYRRYTFAGITSLLESIGWSTQHMAGLTFPVSNVLLPISNFLVARQEGDKKGLTMKQKTVESGYRDVFMKTRFPFVLGLFLNEFVMYPFYLLQKAFVKNDNALVIYVECTPNR